MAEIKSFKGLRFTNKAGDMNKLVCPPYDVISEEQRQSFINENEYNIIRLELPKGENAYEKSGQDLSNWLKEGILKKDDEEGIYVYEMEFTVNGNEVKKVKGFISLVKLVDFSKGIVLPHEETLSKAKEDRFNLMSKTFCNFSQVYSLYMDEDKSTFSLIDAASQGAADTEVKDSDGVIHRLWCVHDKDIISKVSNSFLNKKLYIADGHHRYETALKFHNHLCETGVSNEDSLSGYICMMLVNMENDGLVVMPTHRIVRDLDNFNKDEVVEKCAKYFEIVEKNSSKKVENYLKSLYNDGKSSFALYTGDNKYYVLTLKDKTVIKELLDDMSESYCSLDVTVLHSLVLERLFGIDKENMANQKNLTYTKIIDEAIEAVDNKLANCSFILNPTRVQEIKDVALASEKMPQKSTYFYPKLITGLVMNKFDD